jgi:hypothetical protein
MDWWKAARAHPWITAISVLCAVGGAALSWAFELEGLSPLRRLLAGALAGAGIAYLIVATRILGAFAEDEDEDEAASSPSSHPPG